MWIHFHPPHTSTVATEYPSPALNDVSLLLSLLLYQANTDWAIEYNPPVKLYVIVRSASDQAGMDLTDWRLAP